MNARTMMIALGAAVVFVIGSASGATTSSFEQRRLSKEQFKGILAEAVAEQNNKTLSPELVLDSRGMAAALNVFQKNFGGMSGFLRNPQAKQPPVTHTISDLQKKLGKEIVATEPDDVATIAQALGDCVAYLSSPGLVSYMEPDVARATRQSANSTLQKMNDASTSVAATDLRSLLGRTKAHLDQAATLEATRAQIPAEIAAIQGIEEALDHGQAGSAIEGWKRLTSGKYTLFSFTKKYIDLNTTLMSDAALYNSCQSKLNSIMYQSPQAHAQQLLVVWECEDTAREKPNTAAFLNSIEPMMRQNVEKDFGTVPTKDDLVTWVQMSQKFSAAKAGSVQQLLVSIGDIQVLQNKYSAQPATSALISSSLAHQTEALEMLIAAKRPCAIGAYQLPTALPKSQDALSAQLEKLRQQAAGLGQALRECDAMLPEDAPMKAVIHLLKPEIQEKLRRDAEQLQAGNKTLQAINSRATSVQEEIQRLDTQAAEAEARREARIEEQNSLAENIMNKALMIVMLEEKFRRTSVMGYTMEADKQRQELKNLLRSDRSLLTPAVWKAVNEHFNQILPGLTVTQASQTESLISGLRNSSE